MRGRDGGNRALGCGRLKTAATKVTKSALRRTPFQPQSQANEKESRPEGRLCAFGCRDFSRLGGGLPFSQTGTPIKK
jgi:hypothetical protein